MQQRGGREEVEEGRRVPRSSMEVENKWMEKRESRSPTISRATTRIKRKAVVAAWKVE